MSVTTNPQPIGKKIAVIVIIAAVAGAIVYGLSLVTGKKAPATQSSTK